MAIQKQTYLKAADNSGALELMCFHLDGSTGKKIAAIGDIITCTIKKAIPGAAVKKKQIVKVVIVRTVKPYRRKDGSYISFGENAGVLIKDAEDPDSLVGTRIFGPVARELREKSYAKLVSLAPEVL